MNASWSSDLVTEAGALARLEPDWWELWHRAPGATPFTSPAWAIPWWSAFEPGRLRTVTLRFEGRLVALAPLYLEDGPLGRRLLPIGIGISDHLDLLVDPSLDEAAAGRLVAAVVAVSGWDAWELEELAPGAAALAMPRPRGCTEKVVDQSPCPVLAPLDEALSAVPSGQRRKIRMARHRVARRGGRVDLAGPDELAPFFDTLSTLHTARWVEQGQDGVTADRRVRSFHLGALPRLAAAGLVRATTLTIEDRVVGAYYGLRREGAAYAYIGGFDPAFAFESPGTVLLADAMEAAAREGARAFHLLRGAEPYKYAWGASDHWNRRRSFMRA